MRRSWPTAVVGVITLIAAAAAAAAETFPDVIQLPIGWRPEGIEAGKQHTLYVGSIPTGAVRQIDAQTGESFTLVQPTTGRSATGLEYDPKGERLFISGGGTGFAYVYDAQTGEPIADYCSRRRRRDSSTTTSLRTTRSTSRTHSGRGSTDCRLANTASSQPPRTCRRSRFRATTCISQASTT